MILFWILTGIDIIAIACSSTWIPDIVKPLLMPVLISSLLQLRPNSSNRNLMLVGLFFSWAGDILLLFEKNGAIFFILGLVCFLLTHILYIIYFLKLRSSAVSLLRKYPWLILLICLYSVCLVAVLFPHLKEMKLPVMVYAAVISIMLVCSLHAFKKVNRSAGLYFVSGALLFVISDSLLAVNKFYQPFIFAGILIMLTYCAAQFLIVKGFGSLTQ
ncbi:MAG: lysoplasmalogenase [Ferruginibacter sp.]